MEHRKMKRNYSIPVLFVLGSILFLLVGYKEQAKLAEEPKNQLAVSSQAEQPAKAQVSPEANKPGPRIKFEEVIHNFGEVSPGSKNLCEFKFTNTGKGLLKITKVGKSCGCTPFTLDKEEYAPSESGILKVAYQAASHPGSPSKYLFVYSNDKTNPQVKLTLTATIVRQVDYEPKRLSLSLKQENGGSSQIKLTSLDGRPFSIMQFKSTGDCITADYDPLVKATEFVLKLKVDTEKLRNHLNGFVSIQLSHPGCNTVAILFQVLPEFEINPPSIIILNAEPGKPVGKQAWVLSNYDSDFEVESASSEKGIIKVVSQEKIGKRYKFELQITPPVPEENQMVFTDEFYVQIKGGNKLEANCRGFYSKK